MHKLNSFEDIERFKTFKTNFLNVMEHNKAAEENKHEYKTAINRFSALTRAEYVRRLGVKSTRKPNTTLETQERFLKGLGVALKDYAPAQVSWISRTPAIKNQFSCGGCWSFAAVSKHKIIQLALRSKLCYAMLKKNCFSFCRPVL